MDFAKSLLSKYGWNEGDGLGKNNQGIKNPLKPALKFDNAGLGLDKGSEFTNNWWERVFNDASNNIVVKSNEDDICMSVKDGESIEITTNSYSTKMLKKQNIESPSTSTYTGFLKASTLGNDACNETTETKSLFSNWQTSSTRKPLTDEELFSACSGRTAHKGARFGLKLSGKLSRIAEQDNELLEKLSNNNNNNNIDSDKLKTISNKHNKHKKKYRNKKRLEAEDLYDVDLSELTQVKDYSKAASKKERRKKARLDLQLTTILLPFSLTDRSETTEEIIKKKKKKKKRKLPLDCVPQSTVINDNPIQPLVSTDQTQIGKKRKAGSFTYRVNLSDTDEVSQDESTSTDYFDLLASPNCFKKDFKTDLANNSSKKYKKLKLDPSKIIEELENNNDDEKISTENTTIKKKNKKKKNRKKRFVDKIACTLENLNISIKDEED